MPYLQITTNVPMNRKQKTLIDEAIAKSVMIVPEDKPEFLMSCFEDAVPMILSGDPATPCAMVELRFLASLFDTNDSTIFETLMTILTEVVSRVLEIEKNRIYVTITGAHMWAAGGVDITKGLLQKR